MKRRLTYKSGEEIKSGDHITYHGEPGKVEFIVTEKVGNPAINWYIDQFQQGGFMIVANNFGNVFVTNGANNDLEYLSRAGGACK